MEALSLAEILTAVDMVLVGQKVYEVYKRKKFTNGGGHDRRSNSFAEADRDFIQGCFENQTKEMNLSMESDRLKLVIGIKEIVQDEGSKTRIAVRDNR